MQMKPEKTEKRLILEALLLEIFLQAPSGDQALLQEAATKICAEGRSIDPAN